jgi:hypothetical protein
MQTITEYKSARAQSRPLMPIHQSWAPRRAAPAVRRPENEAPAAEGLSRAELRRIVIDMIG